MELKIEKEKVLEAAETCDDVKKALKILFPEAFEESGNINLKHLTFNEDKDLLFSMDASIKAGFENNHFMQARVSGEYKYTAFFLHFRYHWELKKDDTGSLCLIPTRR